MDTKYSSERNVQMLIFLLKKHGIRKIVASPGATNICLVASLQQDSYFEMYSSVDERSAAYIACGLAAESGEPVALSCTGATASRNYQSGLTEAFYRKLPILAITSTQHIGKIGNHVAQVIDRTVSLNDTVKLSVQIPAIHNAEDEWVYSVMLNKALLELRHRGGGPVHINLATTYSKDYSVSELPETKVIERYGYGDALPEINCSKIGIYVGAHAVMSKKLEESIDNFCEFYNAVVFCDHTSNYHGKYRINPSLVCNQAMATDPCVYVELLIHIGEISGSGMSLRNKDSWRVSPDGEVRDTFRTLTKVFEMKEEYFFEQYANMKHLKSDGSYYRQWISAIDYITGIIPELPFGNAWIAQHTAQRIPKKSVLHLGILNSLRNWNFFDIHSSINGFSNTGGFGIDGCVSSLIGASLNNKNKLYFGIVGDLAFFYDMNSLGNRHLGNNIRLMVINNGKGTEFRNYNHDGAIFGEDADLFIAAGGHYGNKSRNLIKNYVEDLGFEYLTASSKEDYLKVSERFLSPDILDSSIIFEVFTDSCNESQALFELYNMNKTATGTAKKVVKDILGEKGYSALKRLVK